MRSEPLSVQYIPPTKPNLCVMAIGVPGGGLKYAPEDAEQIGQLFKQQEGRLFNRVRTVFLNQPSQTTATQLRNAMGELIFYDITANDVLLLFVSAHGKKQNLRNGKVDFAILPQDYDDRSMVFEENTNLRYKEHMLDNLAGISGKKLDSTRCLLFRGGSGGRQNALFAGCAGGPGHHQAGSGGYNHPDQQREPAILGG